MNGSLKAPNIRKGKLLCILPGRDAINQDNDVMLFALAIKSNRMRDRYLP